MNNEENKEVLASEGEKKSFGELVSSFIKSVIIAGIFSVIAVIVVAVRDTMPGAVHVELLGGWIVIGIFGLLTLGYWLISKKLLKATIVPSLLAIYWLIGTAVAIWVSVVR
jgi:membrane-bound ClpP family serine protease